MIKLADTLQPMADFPAAMAEHIAFNDGDTLQEKLDSGSLGGNNTESEFNTVAFTDNIDMGKYYLLAKITDVQYESHNIIRFSCNNFKGTYGTGYTYEDDVDVYRFDIHFNTGYNDPTRDRGITLKQHGLTLFSYPLNNPQNTSPEIKDAVRLYWDYTNNEIYVFLVEIMTSIPHCVLEYTGSGTLKEEDCFVNDNSLNTLNGTAAKWANSNWKSIPYDKLETPPIYELGGSSGGQAYTSLVELELTADATFQDVVDALPKGGSALLGVTDFTDYQNIFPYEEGNDQFGRVHIVKGPADGSRMYARWFRKDGVKEAIAIFNINDNKFGGWRMLKNQQLYTSLAELGLAADATIEKVIKALPTGGKALISTHEFTNYQTLFPYSEEADQYATLKVEKGYDAAGSRTVVAWIRKDAAKVVYGGLDSTNAVKWWNEIAMKEKFNGKEIKTVTIDLSDSSLQSTSSSVQSVVLSDIPTSARVIRVEGYYTPPEGSYYTEVSVVSGQQTSSQIGVIYRNGSGLCFLTIVGSTASKGSGFVKIYYIE